MNWKDLVGENFGIKLMLLALIMWNINDMAHFNNIRNTILDNNLKIEKIGIKVGALEPENEDDF